MLVYGAVIGTPDTGQNLNTIQHSNTSSELQLACVNSTFSGSLTVTNNLSATNFYTGARVILWPGTRLPTSTDWYGLGMNGGTLVYN